MFLVLLLKRLPYHSELKVIEINLGTITLVEFWTHDSSGELTTGMTLDNIRLSMSNSVIGSFRDPLTEVIKSGNTDHICLSTPDLSIPMGTNLLPGGNFEFNSCWNCYGPCRGCFSDFSKLPLQFTQGLTASKASITFPAALIKNWWAVTGTDYSTGGWSALLASRGDPVTYSQTLYLRPGTYRLSFAMNLAVGSNIPVNATLSYNVSIANSPINNIGADVTFNNPNLKSTEFRGQCYDRTTLTNYLRRYSVPNCLNACQSLGSHIKYAGIAANITSGLGGECFCGSTLLTNPTKRTSCDRVCTTTNEVCGGNYAMNIWERYPDGTFSRPTIPWITTTVSFTVPPTTSLSSVVVMFSGKYTPECVGYWNCGPLLDDVRVVQIA